MKGKVYKCPYTRKVQYANLEHAEKYAGLAIERTGDKDIKPYVCHKCGFWHLGHMSKARNHKIPQWRRGE